MENTSEHVQQAPWNKGVIVGQKSPFKLKEIWTIRVRLQLQHRVRELAMFDLGLDSKLRACDLVKMRVRDICHGEHVSPRATVMQQKTSRPVQFEITQPTRDAVSEWIKAEKRIRNAFDAADQGVLDLSTDKKSACRATTAWSHQAGEHRTLPRHRGG
jgi:integrase